LGAVIGIAKLVPERTKLILEAQLMVMESLREENKRQAEIIARNEVELESLRERVEELCAKAG
jgi:BMFP domain-containing protein YqiC